MEKSERIERGQVLARAIIEMLGAPKEHIDKTLKEYIESLKEDEEMEIVKVEFEEAAEEGKLWAAFAEVEIWFKNTEKLLGFCFDSMPSSIEILEPEVMQLKSNQLSSLLNDLQAKIHRVDLSLKALKAENQIYKKNNQALTKNIVVLCIKNGIDDITSMVKNTGIDEKHLKIILDDLESRGSIKKKGNKYMC